MRNKPSQRFLIKTSLREIAKIQRVRDGLLTRILVYIKNFFMLQTLQSNFPNLTERKIKKLLYCLKYRNEKYNRVWLSRIECTKFGISERQLQNFINFLREKWFLIFEKHKKMLKWFYCNIYRVSQFFRNELQKLRNFVKKQFEYINPLEFMKNHFDYQIKCWVYKFKVDWNTYKVSTKGRFTNKIFSCSENKIVSPLLFKTYKLWIKKKF